MRLQAQQRTVPLVRNHLKLPACFAQWFAREFPKLLAPAP